MRDCVGAIRSSSDIDEYLAEVVLLSLWSNTNDIIFDHKMSDDHSERSA